MAKLILLFLAVICSMPGLANPNLFAQEKPDQGIYHDTWIDRNKNGKQNPYENPKLPVKERVTDLLERMNIDEETVMFEIDPLLDFKTMGPEYTWIVEPGDFEVMIADSSSDEAIKQQGSFTLK